MAAEDVGATLVEGPPTDCADQIGRVGDPETESIGSRIGGRQRVGDHTIAEYDHVVVPAEVVKVADHGDGIGQDAPVLESGAGPVQADRGLFEIVGVIGQHVRHRKHRQALAVRQDVDSAQAIRGERAPVFKQQDARAARADQRDGQVRRARMIEEQADIERRNLEMAVDEIRDGGHGVVQDGHHVGEGELPEHRHTHADVYPGHNVNRDHAAAQVAKAHDVFTALQRRHIVEVNRNDAAGPGDVVALALARTTVPRADLEGERAGARKHADGDGEIGGVRGNLDEILAAGVGVDIDRQAVRQVLLLLEEDEQRQVRAAMGGRVVHHGQPPLRAGSLAGEIVQAARAIGVLRPWDIVLAAVIIDKVGIGDGEVERVVVEHREGLAAIAGQGAEQVAH